MLFLCNKALTTNYLWLIVPVKHLVLLITTANGIKDLKVIGCSDKRFGVVTVHQDIIDINLFQLQQFL